MNLNKKHEIGRQDGRLFRHRKTIKVSDDIIQQIRDLFLSGKLNPGDKLGSEKELMDTFGVSKSTLREALRVLEAMGIIEIRKGLTGGVFAAQVDMKTTMNSIQGFLKFESVSIHDVTMLRYLLEPGILHVVISNLSDVHVKKLQKTIQESQILDPMNKQVKGISFHRYLARVTQNPMLILIMDFIDNVLEDLKKKVGLSNDFYSAMDNYHQQTLKYIIKKDVSTAQKIMREDILATGDFIAKAMRCKAFNPK